MLTNPAMSMLTTKCFQNWWVILERQEVRSCPFRIQLSSPLWSGTGEMSLLGASSLSRTDISHTVGEEGEDEEDDEEE